MKYSHLRTLIEIRTKRIGVSRLFALYVPFCLFMLVIAACIVRFSLKNGKTLKAESEKNMFCAIPLPPVRGDITDRNGVIIATDNSEFRVVRIGENCAIRDVRRLRAYNDPGAARNTQAASPAAGEQLFREISSLVEKTSGAEPGRFVDMVPRRIYPYGEYASQIVGYLGEINADETRMLRHLGYRPGDRVGKSGIEKWYETSINGKPGAREILIDAPGHILYQKKILPAGKGAGLALSIDMRLQRVAVDAFRNRNASGAAVFMDSRTGEIIALASWPSFSPAPGPDGLTPANWSSLASDPAHPLLNRAVAGGLPPGSVFKLVVAAAALEEKAAAPASTFFCPGYYMLPGRESYPPKCNAVHGRIGFIDGIAQSCDVVFYTLGQKLGVTNIDKYAKLFGLGSKTGIDCPGESVGLLPDEYWKQHFGSGGRWTPGDTINLSIGQGDTQVTPIQIARMVNVFATRGLLVSPHIARNGEWPAVKLPLYAETIRTVRAGMRGAVQRGTCRGMADFPVAVAAKTGTAQTGTRADPKKAHAWFAGFAPFDNPTVTFAIYVEHGGFGAEAALPIAREILQKALDLGYLK